MLRVSSPWHWIVNNAVLAIQRLQLELGAVGIGGIDRDGPHDGAAVATDSDLCCEGG